MLPLALFLVPAAYQALAIYSGMRHRVRQRREERTQPAAAGSLPGVSVLKPLRGLDPNTAEAFRSQVIQHFEEYEVLFGISDEDDPAAQTVRALQREFPDVAIRLIAVASEDLKGFANGKVAVLAALGREARYPVWVINDSDIQVGPDYLARVTAPLAEAAIGLVTCLYRAVGHTPAAAWESFGIACDFMPSTLVAQSLGVREFGLGSTLAFRSSDLARAGGLEALADYIADDYQLALRITRLGLRAHLSTYVVETALGQDDWSGVWRHQLRWARTIRASKGAGFAGLPITHAGLFIALLLLWRQGRPLAAWLYGLRITSAWLTGFAVLRSPMTLRLAWFAPVWDFYAFFVWCFSYTSREVVWRDRRLRIEKGGKIRVK